MSFIKFIICVLEIARFQDGFVKTKLNERLFEKVQGLEEKRAQLYKDQKRIAKLKKGGPQKRKQAELEELQMKKQEGKNKKSLDEEQRAIHESYQILLNEYYCRKAYREKGSKPLKSIDEDDSQVSVGAPKLIISNEEVATINKD